MNVSISTSEWQPAPATTKAPFVAIGDIHGCGHLLRPLRAHLNLEAPHRRIYLGDFIDPYPEAVPDYDVPDVFDQIAEDLDQGHVALAGNHELMLIHCMNYRIEGKRSWPGPVIGTWLSENQGNFTLRQFGVLDNLPVEERMAMLESNLSARHRHVLASLKTFHKSGKYLFVHAGFHEEIPWRKQIEEENWFEFPVPNRWAPRPHPFWNSLHGDEGPENKVQINGHKILRQPFVGKRRIAIDTGAKIGGPLTALEIVGDRLRFHQARQVSS
jgi:serine/threonine protein phosphatase 1